MDVHHLKHTLKLCLESRYLSDRARGNVMQLTSRMRFSASLYPPSAASAPTHASSPALSHLSALQGSMRASHTMCSPARRTAFQSASSSHRSESRASKRRSSSSNKPVATSAQFGRGMRAPQSAVTANVILPAESIAVLEGFGLEREDVLEAQLQGALSDGDILLAFAGFEGLRDGGRCPTEGACNGLIPGLCSRGHYRKAWAVFKASQQEGHVMNYMTYQTLITASAQAGELYNALRVYRALEEAGMQPNVVTCCGLIAALGRARRQGEREEGYLLWQELFASGQDLDAAAYRTGINACVGVRELVEARGLLATMRGLGLPPDIRAYNMLMKGAARGGYLPALDDLMDALRAEGLEPNKVTYNTVVDAYVRAGLLERAAECLTAAGSAGIVLDAWSWSALMKGHVRQGDLRSGLALLKEMSAAGVSPNEVTYTTLINGYTRSGNLKVARDLLAEMKVEGVAPNEFTYNSLLRGYALRGPAFKNATFELLKEMSDAGVGPTGDTFNTLMDAAIVCGDPEATLRLYKQMREAGFAPDTVTYTTIIKAYTRLDRVEDAIVTFRQMEDNPDAPVDLSALNQFVDALARSERMDGAQRVLLRATEMANRLGEAPPRQAYGALIAGYARMRDIDGALATLRKFHSVGGVPDSRMFDVLIDVCIKQGEFKRALQVTRAMERTGAVADKAKYKRLIAELYRRDERQQTYDGDRRVKNDALERFKFWLGMPSRYYENGDWDWQDRSADRDDQYQY